ncbi:DNA repair protein Rad4 [Trichuris suis]|nr:DNA repair protein Rad4 [Trichuris suis]
MKTRAKSVTSPYFASLQRTGATGSEDSEIETGEETKPERKRPRKRNGKKPKKAKVAKEPSVEANDQPPENTGRKPPKRQRGKKGSAEAEDQKPHSNAKKGKRTLTNRRAKNSPNNSPSDGSTTEWEDVENSDCAAPSTSSQVELVVKSCNTKEENKKHFSLIRRYLNRIVKIRKENRHQILLLCFLAHGQHSSKCCSDTLTLGFALSMVPPSIALGESSHEEAILNRLNEKLCSMFLTGVVGNQREHTMDGASLLHSMLDKLDSSKSERSNESTNAIQASPEKERATSNAEKTCINLYSAGPLYSSEPLEFLRSDEMAYCLGFDNEHMAKDVTLRYATDSAILKYRQWRIVDNWWLDVLRLFKPVDAARDDAENELIERQLVERPLPKKISEYKNHPLLEERSGYVLERDLLKFQALYPKDVQPIGYCSKVPVYRRSAVHQLNGKEAWIREARVIKDNEEPYKIVKARPKMGVVPRNKFGNVELYQMKMLPKGTVYLDAPGLPEVARKLDIDCVPAVVGWEFHCRSSHPILKGFVVCEEFKDILMDAWKEERMIAVRKAKERKSKRAMQNWRRLVRGLLIKSNLAKTFLAKKEVAEAAPSTSSAQPLAWPQCRQDFTFEGSLSD